VCLLRGTDWVFIYNSGYVFCVDLGTNSDYFPIQQWLVFITEMECVYCAVRTGSLYIIQVVCFVWISEQTAIISLYSPYTAMTGFYNRDGVCLLRGTGWIFIYNSSESQSTFCPHSVFMCFVWISEQTAIISLYNINWLVFITETVCVYCAVRTEYLNII